MSIEGELRAIRAMLEPALIKMGFSQRKPRRFTLAQARVELGMKPADLARAIRRKDVFVLTERGRKFIPLWEIERILDKHSESSSPPSKPKRATTKR